MAPPTSPPAAAAEPQPTTLPNYFTLVYLDAIIQMLNEQTDQVSIQTHPHHSLTFSG